ncbi:MAG: hypothetical protein NC548_05595 [Lachnospiraceae bacterium]|nr:hypothetical protein [Lachnospiraceae bacterium]
MRIVDENMEIFINDLKPEIRKFVLQAFGAHPMDKNLYEMETCKPLVTIPIGSLPLEKSIGEVTTRS